MMSRAALRLVVLAPIALLCAGTACSPAEEDASLREAAATLAEAPLREPGRIGGAELAALLGTAAEPLLLDVRSRDEFAGGHIPGAVNIPYDELPDRLEEIASHRDGEIVVYCRTGRRAKIAEAALSAAGFREVRDLDGHMTEWRQARRPVTEAVPCC